VKVLSLLGRGAQRGDRQEFTDDEIRAHRIAHLEKVLGVTLDADVKALCVSQETTAAEFAARLHAGDGAGTLRVGALGAVREALREHARADRESVGEETELAPFFPRWIRSRRWAKFGKELGSTLPIVEPTWVTAAVAALLVAVQMTVNMDQPSHHLLSGAQMAGLVATCFASVLGVYLAMCTARFPRRVSTAGALVNWLVASHPSKYRAGTQWTRGQVRETVDAVASLRFERPGCRRVLTSPLLVSVLLILTLVGVALRGLYLGAISRVVVGGPVPAYVFQSGARPPR
jgi:hypothetical protein